MAKDSNEVVCWCKGVTRDMISGAIRNGARSAQDVSRMTGAGTGTECAQKNPKGT